MIELAEIKIVRIHIETTLADRETDHIFAEEVVSNEIVHCEIWMRRVF